VIAFYCFSLFFKMLADSFLVWPAAKMSSKQTSPAQQSSALMSAVYLTSGSLRLVIQFDANSVPFDYGLIEVLFRKLETSRYIWNCEGCATICHFITGALTEHGSTTCVGKSFVGGDYFDELDSPVLMLSQT
jgi:hypothetical protein